ARRRVQHRVVLAEHVDPTARPADALQFGEHPPRFWYRLRHVPEYAEVESAGAELQLERVALLESHARRQRRIPPARVSDRGFQDVHPDQLGFRVKRGKPRSDLATD